VLEHCENRAAPRRRSAAHIFRAMLFPYAGTWFHTVKFQQKTTIYTKDGRTTNETWYETAKLPGTLRIDKAPLSGDPSVSLK
jgi:hypothetical protein